MMYNGRPVNEVSKDKFNDQSWQVLDAWTHGGLPQRRSRVWIVGTTIHATKSTLASGCSLSLYYFDCHPKSTVSQRSIDSINLLNPSPNSTII